MLELLNAALEPVTMLYSILMVVILLYWGSVIIGALDFSAFDLDFDLDADADIDADGGAATTGWLAGALHFFNFGRLPFMVIMTVVITTAWSLSILGNYYLGHNGWGFALATFIPNLFVSLLVAKGLTAPLVPLFQRLDGTAEAVDYIGRTCRIRLPASASAFGQAEVIVDDASLLISVKTESDELALASGEAAVIVGRTPDRRYYLVRRLEPENV
jgi:hypothetical protein